MLAKLFQEFHPIGAAPKHAVADTRNSQRIAWKQHITRMAVGPAPSLLGAGISPKLPADQHLGRYTLLLHRSPTREALLLRDQRRPTDSFCLEVDSYVDMVGDLDERNTAVNSVVLTVEDHGPLNLARARFLAGNSQRQLLRLRYSADRKFPSTS